MLFKLCILLLLCGSTAAQEVREDEANRFNLFVTALASCSPSGSNRWHVVCVLEQVSPAELHVVRMHAPISQVGVYLLDELSQRTAAQYAKSHLAARISWPNFKTVSKGVVEGIQELQRVLARIGAQRWRTNTRRVSRQTLLTSRALARTLLGTGNSCMISWLRRT